MATIHNKILVDMRFCNILELGGREGYIDSKTWEIDINGDVNGPTAKFRAST